MFRFLLNILSGTSGTSGTGETPFDLGANLTPALEILWKGMVGIFVVSTVIVITVKVLNKLLKDKK